MNGDEEDGKDEYIVPVDGYIADDELYDLLSEHLPEGVRCPILLCWLFLTHPISTIQFQG